MLCRYMYRDIAGLDHPVYQADTEDFKKFFRRCQRYTKNFIVEIEDGERKGEIWIWQRDIYEFNKKIKRSGNGWSLARAAGNYEHHIGN